MCHDGRRKITVSRSGLKFKEDKQALFCPAKGRAGLTVIDYAVQVFMEKQAFNLCKLQPIGALTLPSASSAHRQLVLFYSHCGNTFAGAPSVSAFFSWLQNTNNDSRETDIDQHTCILPKPKSWLNIILKKSKQKWTREGENRPTSDKTVESVSHELEAETRHCDGLKWNGEMLKWHN